MAGQLEKKSLEHNQVEDGGEIAVKRESNPDLRTYGVGAQILLDLEVRKCECSVRPSVCTGFPVLGWR